VSEVLAMTSMPIPKATPLDLLNRAAAAGAAPELLAQYMSLYERWEERQAKKAYDRAIALAKAEIPTIVKNRQVDFTSQKGRTNYKYEDLASIENAVAPILGKYGLSYRFKTEAQIEKQIVVVTCHISHEDGHSEENSLPGPYDASGNKNAIQQLGSTVTYLERYTLKASLGLAASNDDDGRGAANGKQDASPVTIEQLGRIQQAMVQGGVAIDWLLEFLKKRGVPVERLEDIPAAKCDSVIKAIEARAAQNERSGEISSGN
jgi:hypothetical protein